MKELARLVLAASEAVEAAALNTPSDWGLRLGDRIYGGPSVFWWAGEQRLMLDFVCETLPLLPFESGEVAEDDLSMYRARRRDTLLVVSRLAANEISWAAAQRGLNGVFGNLIPIEWWGQFADLCAADSDFSRDLMRRFRKLKYDETPSPVLDSEVSEFMEFIEGFGF